MSRNLINGDVECFYGKMDVLTIDARRLQIPASGVRGKSRGREIQLSSGALSRDAHSEQTPSVSMSAGSKREDVVIDIRPKGDAKGVVETPGGWETHAITIPLGYFVFCLAIASCNLFWPAFSHAVCTGLSPLLMLCILAHSMSIQPVWIAWGMLICAWLTPSVCVLWSVEYSVLYLVSLVSFAVAGCRRLVPLLCMVVVFGCSPLALNPQWTGLEPKLWITVEVFFSALACATAYTGGGKIFYRIKPIV